MMGLLDGYVGDDTTRDEYGMTQADRREPIFSGLIRAGLLGVAAGGNIMPSERAQYLAQAGGAIADIPMQMAQRRQQGAQDVLRQQQIKTQREDLEQKEKWRALANDPTIQQELADVDPATKVGALIALAKGDI